MKNDRFKVLAKGAAVGIALFVATAATLLSLITTLIMNETLRIESIDVASVVTGFLALMIGTVTTYKLTADQSVLPALINTIGALLVCCVMTILFFDGLFERVWGGVVAGILGSVIGMIIGRKHKKRSSHKKWR